MTTPGPEERKMELEWDCICPEPHSGRCALEHLRVKPPEHLTGDGPHASYELDVGTLHAALAAEREARVRAEEQLHNREEELVRARASWMLALRDRTVERDDALAKLAEAEKREAALEEWKADEQRFLIAAAARLIDAGYHEGGLLKGIEYIVAELDRLRGGVGERLTLMEKVCVERDDLRAEVAAWMQKHHAACWETQRAAEERDQLRTRVGEVEGAMSALGEIGTRYETALRRIDLSRTTAQGDKKIIALANIARDALLSGPRPLARAALAGGGGRIGGQGEAPG